MKKLKKEQNLLKEALKDLNQELKNLRSSKKTLEKKLKKLSGALGTTKEWEIKLRNEISKLMHREDLLTKRRINAKDKLLTIKKKMEKIKSIGRELKEV